MQDLAPSSGGGVYRFELDVKNGLLFVKHLLIISGWGGVVYKLKIVFTFHMKKLRKSVQTSSYTVEPQL